MTSSRSEFVQNAIDSAIASRSIDVHEYLNGPRRPILEQLESTSFPAVQQDALSSIPAMPVQETLAPDTDAAVTAGITVDTTLDDIAQSNSTNEPDLQQAIDHAIKNAVNVSTVDVYGYLKKASPVVPPKENDSGDKKTSVKDTGLTQEEATPVLSENIQNAIQSAVNSGGIDSQSYLTKYISTAPEVPSKENVTSTQETSDDIVDESINNKLSEDAVPSATLSAIDDGAREPQHSAADSAGRTPVASSDFGNEIDNALENAIHSNGNQDDDDDDDDDVGVDVDVDETETKPQLPPKESELPEDQVPIDGKINQLDANVVEQQNTDGDNNKEEEGLKNSAKAVAEAVGASAATTTAGAVAFASEKKNKLKSKINEKVNKVCEPDQTTYSSDKKPSFTPVTDDPLSQSISQQETDISDQTIPQEKMDVRPTPIEPIQDKPEPASESIQGKPTPPEPLVQDIATPVVIQNEPTIQPEPTSPETVIKSELVQPEPAVIESKSPEAPTATAPEPPSKHHHHKLLPNKPGHKEGEKSKKCVVM